jgi:hypothetical protein
VAVLHTLQQLQADCRKPDAIAACLRALTVRRAGCHGTGIVEWEGSMRVEVMVVVC